MAVKISDLLPKKVLVPTGGGDLEVGPVSLEGVAAAIANHREAVLHLIASSAAGTPNFVKVLGEFPDLCAELLAHACDAKGQEADIKQLPAAVQLVAIGEAWRLSVPDPKKLGQYASLVMAQLQGLSQRSVAAPVLKTADSTSKTSSETSPAASAS